MLQSHSLTKRGGWVYGSNNFNDRVSGRGNSSWTYEKKPYNIFLDKKECLIGHSIATKYVLLANASDESNIRASFFNQMASETSSYWNPKTVFVDLYVNNEYRGLYALSEKVEISEDKLDLAADSILFNLELTGRNEEPSVVDLFEYVSAEIKYPRGLSNTQLKSIDEEIRGIIDGVVSHSISEDKLDAYIDIESWAWLYLVQEVSENYDSGICSLYFYYERGRLYAGPVWDYDNTLGVRYEFPPDTYMARMYSKYMAHNTPLWYCLCQYDSFKDMVSKLYQQRFYMNKDSFLNDLSIMGRLIMDSSAMDSIKWPEPFDNVGTQCIGKIGVMLDDRMDFLYRALVERQPYYMIVYTDTKNFRVQTIPEGKKISQFPYDLIQDSLKTLNAGKEFKYWIDAETGGLYDSSQPIKKDITLLPVFE